MSLYSQNISNQPLTLNGLVTGNFDVLYVDGSQVNTNVVPYTGATMAVDLNNQNLSSVNTLTGTNASFGIYYTISNIFLPSTLQWYITISTNTSPFKLGQSVTIVGCTNYPTMQGTYTVTGTGTTSILLGAPPSGFTTSTYYFPLNGYLFLSNTGSLSSTTASVLNATIPLLNSNYISTSATGQLYTVTSISIGATSAIFVSPYSAFTAGQIFTVTQATPTFLNTTYTVSISTSGNAIYVTNPGFATGSYYFSGYAYLDGTLGSISTQVSNTIVAATAPTMAVGNNSNNVATTSFVQSTASGLLVSPSFSGTPTAPTATAGTNTTQVATTEFVTTAISAIPAGSYIGITGTTSGVNSTLKLTASGIFSVQSSLGIPYFTINGAGANPYVATYGLSSATYIALTTTSFAAPAVGVNGGSGDRLIVYQGTSSTYPASIGMSASNVMWFSSPLQMYWYLNGATMMTLTSSQLVVSSTSVNLNALNVVGSTGKISMSNTNSAAPAVFGGGSGDRIILSPGSGSTYPYSIGINSYTLWNSIPTNAQYLWYIGGIVHMILTNTAKQGLGIGNGSTDPACTLDVVGIANIWTGTRYAVINSQMAPGSLTLGSITSSYGGGSTWTTNTAGLLMETNANQEIAVHHGGNSVNSLIYYQGSNRRLFIGRNMGWGVNNVQFPGAVYTDDWFRPTSNTNGMYWEGLGWGIGGTGGSTYGNVTTFGAGKNTWSGYDINSRWTFMANGSACGIHDLDNSWRLYFSTAGTPFSSLTKRTSIGSTSEPTGMLDVFGDCRVQGRTTVSTGGIYITNTNNNTTHLPYWPDGNSYIRSNLIVDQNYLSIGTSTVQFPLYVATGANYYFFLANYFNQNGGYNGACAYNGYGTWAVSAYFANATITNQWYATVCDIRIKENITPVGPMLDIINQIRIVSFDMIDKNQKRDECGVIAQQLEKVFPNAVEQHVGAIPCYGCKASHTVLEDGTVELVFDTKNTPLSIGDKIKIVTGTEFTQAVDHIVDVLSVGVGKCTVSKWGTKEEELGEVFVYGKQVDDFRNVDTPQLGVLALKGVQELSKMIADQDKVIKEQGDTITALSEHMIQLTNQLNELTRKLKNIPL